MLFSPTPRICTARILLVFTSHYFNYIQLTPFPISSRSNVSLELFHSLILRAELLWNSPALHKSPHSMEGKIVEIFLSLIYIISFVMSLAQSRSHTKTLFIRSFIDSAQICIWKIEDWILSEKFRVAHQSEIPGVITGFEVQKIFGKQSKSTFNWKQKQQKVLKCCVNFSWTFLLLCINYLQINKFTEHCKLTLTSSTCHCSSFDCTISNGDRHNRISGQTLIRIIDVALECSEERATRIYIIWRRHRGYSRSHH